MQVPARIVRRLFRYFADHMPQLVEDELVHRQESGFFRTGDRDHNRALVEAGRGAAHDRRGADVLVAEIAEDLAESVQAFFQEAVDRLAGGIPPRDARSAVHDDRLDVAVLRTLLDQLPDGRRLVLDEVVGCDRVAAFPQGVHDQRAAGVGLGRLSIAEGDYHAGDRPWRDRIVLLVRRFLAAG